MWKKCTCIHTFSSQRESIQTEVRARRPWRTSQDIVRSLGLILYILVETREAVKLREFYNRCSIVPHPFLAATRERIRGGQEEVEYSS